MTLVSTRTLIYTMFLKSVIFVFFLINSPVFSTIVNSDEYEIVFPKFYTKSQRHKRDLTSNIYHEFDINITIVKLNDWLLEFDNKNVLLLSENFTVTSDRESFEIDNCEFLNGKIYNIESKSAITLCDNQITGFINIGLVYYFIQPLNNSEAHVLYKSRVKTRENNLRREKRNLKLNSVCYTTEFYNLTEDIEIDKEVIELNDFHDNEGIDDKIEWEKEQIDPEEIGYFYDSAWETHIFKKRKSSKIFAPKRWLEIAIGVDYSVINFHGKTKVQRYILALMNIVSAIYQDPSLEANLQLVLTRMILYEHKKYSPIKQGNARKSLENVNAWNRKLHITLNAGEPRHDVAIWLTRTDIGGPSGYAPVSGACDPNRSCTLNRDEGLTSAFIIAHEMAHVLGLTHDGDQKANNTCEDEALEGSIMAPMVAATFHKFAWSTCSKREFHRRVTKWFCLQNAPPGKGEVVLKPTLQTTFSMDEQCRMEFGNGYQMCQAFDIIEPCSHLWCGHKNTSLVCKTKKGPPLEGTECGPNKFCINGYCEADTYGYQLDPVSHNPQDGGWTNWSQWGTCSKSCGFGVRFRTRFCNNPSPAYGGSYCDGDPEEFEICSKDKCPEPLQDMRAEQCARLPKMLPIKDIDKQNLTWLPYESEKRTLKCKLTCLSKQTLEIFSSDENLLDGTPCSYDVESDICIQGICQSLSCDGSLKQELTEDSCGVCGGNNSQCLSLTSDFQRNIRREVSKVGAVPRLARNIKIECRISSVRNQIEKDVFFMMRDRRKGVRYNLTLSDGKFSNTFVIRGAKFHCSKRGNHLKLWARGPLLEEIAISFFASPSTINSGIGISVSSSYSIHKDTLKKGSRFFWELGGFGPCSASCGGGQRTRTVACRDKATRRIVIKRHCTLMDKPNVVTEKCNTFSCRFHWVSGDWEYCTTTCGSNGIQSREIYCVHHSINGLNSLKNATRKIPLWKNAVRPDHCSTDDKPEVQRPCNRRPCIAYWQPTQWSQCSTTCGAGVATRDFHCPPPKGESVYTCGPKPEQETKKCRTVFNRKNNSSCKKRKAKHCKEDFTEICTLTDYLGRYCIIPQYRKFCCKSCSDFKRFSA